MVDKRALYSLRGTVDKLLIVEILLVVKTIVVTLFVGAAGVPSESIASMIVKAIIQGALVIYLGKRLQKNKSELTVWLLFFACLGALYVNSSLSFSPGGFYFKAGILEILLIIFGAIAIFRLYVYKNSSAND